MMWGAGSASEVIFSYVLEASLILCFLIFDFVTCDFLEEIWFHVGLLSMIKEIDRMVSSFS